MKIFIERKYPEIYAEYVKLYNTMESESPNRRNLATSPSFKKWIAANPIKESAQTTRFSTTSSLLVPQLILELVHLPAQEDEQAPNILTQAFQEALASLPHTVQPVQSEPVTEHPLPSPEAEVQLPDDINPVDDILND